MSKATKKSFFVLMALLIVALGFSYITLSDLKETEENLTVVKAELEDTRFQSKTKEQKHLVVVRDFKTAADQMNLKNNKLIEQIKKTELQAQEQVDALSREINTITDDRDKWKRRIETIQKERDKLMVKISDLNKKLDEKIEAKIVYKETPPQIVEVPIDVSTAPSIAPGSGRIVDEQYWANLLKEKASLQVDIRDLKNGLTEKSIALVEIKQKNEDMKLEVNTLKSEKEEIETKVQHTADMIDNISLELARTKNDKKFISNRAKKLNDENKELRRKMKKLVSVKNALEKSIVRITREKDKIRNQLGRTETLIQSKIDEIWDIKDELDHSIRLSKNSTFPNEVELPPIVVSSTGAVESFNTGEVASGFDGQVISINEPNNFVIVDIGENSGIHLGDNLSVYRDSKYIARLEVIQVREDISAADLKDQWSKIKVGDIIR